VLSELLPNIHLFIHSSNCCIQFKVAVAVGEQRVQVFPFPAASSSSSWWLHCCPSQQGNIILPVNPGCAQSPPNSYLYASKGKSPEGFINWCPNHLHQLLTVCRSNGSILSLLDFWTSLSILERKPCRPSEKTPISAQLNSKLIYIFKPMVFLTPAFIYPQKLICLTRAKRSLPRVIQHVYTN